MEPALRVLRATGADRLRASGFCHRCRGGTVHLHRLTKLGERIEWHGHLSIEPIESDGELQINGLRAHTIWEYLADRLNFTIDSGTIDLASTYKFALKDAMDSRQPREASLTDLVVKPRNSDSAWVTFPHLKVTGAQSIYATAGASRLGVSIGGKLSPGASRTARSI